MEQLAGLVFGLGAQQGSQSACQSDSSLDCQSSVVRLAGVVVAVREVGSPHQAPLDEVQPGVGVPGPVATAEGEGRLWV